MKHFPGSTRRPRNVNLSGKSKPSPGLATAREERARREHERQQLIAASKIQSVYRGYASRKSLQRSLRIEWDKAVGFPVTSPGLVFSESDLALLLLFCDVKDRQDLQRLSFAVSFFCLDDRASSVIRTVLQKGDRSRLLVTRLSRKLLDSLSRLAVDVNTIRHHYLSFLEFISYSASYLPNLANTYYFSTIGDLVSQGLLVQETTGSIKSFGTSTALVLQSIVLPLQSVFGENRLSVYIQFLKSFLAIPGLDINFFSTVPVSTFHHLLDTGHLIQATSYLEPKCMTPEQNLWLLAYLIYFVYGSQVKSPTTDTPAELSILSHPLYQAPGALEFFDSKTLFQSFAAILRSATETYNPKATSQISHEMAQNYTSRPPNTLRLHIHAPALNIPSFVKCQLERLVETDFIRSLTDSAPSKHLSSLAITSKIQAREAAQGFLLYILLNFRFLQQKIHNRLFLARTENEVPLLIALFKQMLNTKTFQNGIASAGEIREGLRLNCRNEGTDSDTRVLEWKVILLFLDLYCFANVVMDDEEFFSFGNRSLTQAQLQPLIKFLKNLAFVTYFQVSEIEYQASGESVLRLSAVIQSRSQFESRSDIAGIRGVTLSWVRSLAVRVLRSLHRRDSRQAFLSKDFWLMSEIDMEGSTHLIAEEEVRQQEIEDIENAHESDSGEDVGLDDARIRQSQHSTKNKRHEKEVRYNYLAAITPHLEILQNLPFLIPFRTRVSLFRDLIRLDQVRRGTGDRELWRLNQINSSLSHTGTKGKHHGTIHRDRIFEDAYDEFYTLGDGFKEPIQITFVDSFGAEEPGIDGGGILKEFLSSLVQESCRIDPNKGLPFFAETEDHMLYPNPILLDQLLSEGLDNTSFSTLEPASSYEILELLKRFEFLGRIIGKCMYEGILVDVVFADFFLLKWSKVTLGSDDMGLGVDDLKSLDRPLWKGLQALKHYDSSIMEGIGLNFTVENTLRESGSLSFGPGLKKVVVAELKPNGSQIPVTTGNRLEYIHLLSKYKLAIQGKRQTNAFLKGLSSIISPRWLSMFNQAELQTLVGGNESPLDMDDLQKNTVYGGIYTPGEDNMNHPTIVLFWRVMRRMRESDKRAVLKFVTSVSRAPLLGFETLNPRFSIRDAGSDSTRLPSTSTCVNLLKLPRYQSEAVLEEKLLYAVNAGAGFDLS